MTELPLSIGAREDFALVRERLHAAKFDEPSIRSALGIEQLWRLGELDVSRTSLPPAEANVLALVVRAFLCLERVPVAAARQLLGASTFGAFERLGLLVPSPVAGLCEAPVLLYPVGSLILASDRHRNADGTAFTPPSDAVFPAIFPGTTRFLRLLPTGAFDAAIDLGSGTGVGALALSDCSRIAVAADITVRAKHFAEFNRQLNDRPGVEVVCGDLYEPVAGRDFDCIVAHPPYMPTAAESFVFRDGGETGESLLRQIVTGLPQFLRPGGVFLGLSAAWDTATAPFEIRVREWLSERGDPNEYLVLLAVETEMPAGELAEQLERRARRGGDALTDTVPAGRDVRDARMWTARFSEMGLTRHVYGALAITRRADVAAGATARPAGSVTRRTRLGDTATGASISAALRQMAWRADHEAAGTLSRALEGLRPRLSTEANLHVTYTPQDGGMVPVDAVLELAEPFHSRTRMEPWMLSFIGSFDGRRSLTELYATLRAANAVPDAFDLAAFIQVAGMMLDRGYLEADVSES